MTIRVSLRVRSDIIGLVMWEEDTIITISIKKQISEEKRSEKAISHLWVMII